MLYIKAYRHIRNIDQVKLAQDSGLTQATISNIERGEANPTYATLNKIAMSLNIPVSNLSINPVEEVKLNRHEIDEIAKSIINGKLPSHPKKASLAKDIALLQTQKLAAADKPGKRFARGSRWNTKSRYLDVKNKYSGEIVSQVLKRVDKLLAS
jgi:transcriptional regulator with XRE-family HTH domain